MKKIKSASKNIHPWSIGIKVNYLVTMKEKGQIIENAFIGIHKDIITFVGPYKPEYKKKSKKWIDLKNHIVMPGLINTHAHLAMTLFRGLEDDLPLKNWLFDKIFPAEAQFVTPSFVEVGTQLAAYECIRFGTTCSTDMYFYPEKGLQVWDKMGLRGHFSQPLISFPSPEGLPEQNQLLFNKFEKLYKKYLSHPRLSVGLAPHAPYTCSTDLLTQVAQYQERLGCLVQIHLAETVTEGDDIKNRYQKSPTQHLYELGLLNSKTICAHVVHTSKADQNLLQKTQTSLAHNPDSNFKLGSGIAPVTQYLKQNINVSLGTDGSASNNDLSLFGAMDLASKGQKVLSSDISSFKAWDALWMATQGGAKALGMSHLVGSIEVGKQADLIAIDTHFAHLTPLSDPASHLVYCTQGLEVDLTMVAGNILMENKKIKSKDFSSTLIKAQKIRNQMTRFLSSNKK